MTGTSGLDLLRTLPTPSPPGSGTQARLLDAALEVVARDGLRGLTHRRLEDEAGVARGSARYHLGSHEQIVAAALEHVAAREIRSVQGALQRLAVAAVGSSRPLSLPDAATAVVQALGEDPVALRARYELMLESGRSEGLREHAARWRASFVAAVRPLVERAAVKDPDTAAALVIALVDGVLFEECVTGRRPSGPSVADGVAALLASSRAPTDGAPDAAHP